MNLTPIESHTDWTLMIVLVVIFLAIAGLIWWHRRTPTEAQKEIKEITDQLKDLMGKIHAAPAVPAPPPDPLFYNGIRFKTAEDLAKYKALQAELQTFHS